MADILVVAVKVWRLKHKGYFSAIANTCVIEFHKCLEIIVTFGIGVQCQIQAANY